MMSLAWVLAGALGVSGPHIVSYFQVDCPACRQQFTELACMEKKGWTVELRGVGDDPAKLMFQAKKYGVQHWMKGSLNWAEARRLGMRGTPSHFIKTIELAQGEWLQGVLACPK